MFSRRPFAASFLPPERVHAIPPSIDPFAPKNADLGPDHTRAVLAAVGLIAGDSGPVSFRRADGSTGRIQSGCDIIRAGPPPGPDVPLVVQVSRWDRLKDMEGVLTGFADHVGADLGAQLVLVGPVVSSVADDPEGAAILEECWRTWRQLPDPARRRIQLVCIPMTDLEENATVVNALQRHAAVVTQKSLAEGFGLTVSEAMFKSRPVVGGAVGGIVDQVVDGLTGRLLADPTDLASFGTAVADLLGDPERARRYRDAGRQRVIDEFLPDRHLARWAGLLTAL